MTIEGFKSTSDMLRNHAAIFEQRNTIYGANYLNIGPMFAILFPEGLTLRTADDFNRFHLYMLEMVKLTRYGAQFEKGGHADSADDGAVYWAMLREVDDRIAFEAAVVAEAERQRNEEARRAAEEAIAATLDPAAVASEPAGDAEQPEAPPEPPAPADGLAFERRDTFAIPEGQQAVRDADGRATGEVEPIPAFLQQPLQSADNNALAAAIEEQRASEAGSGLGNTSTPRRKPAR